MQFCSSTRKICQVYWLGLFGILCFPLCADIATDGTVGPAQTLNGPAFTIPESLGSRAGANLFHSFQRFNIVNGEQATFSGSSSISNVISRVTGGQISNIDGLLRSTIGQADFYFLNPAGVVFGSNAQIDVPGSFYVSTANELRFADGSVYSATTPSASNLTIDQPEAFGFLGDQTASIRLRESNLVLTPGSTLSLSAGEMVIDSSQLTIDRGEVQFVATGDTATAMTTDGNLSNPGQGNLSITQTVVDVSGDGAGRISIRSGLGEISTSEILANNSGPTNAGSEQGINIHATTFITDGSTMRSRSSSEGNAGNITVNAEYLEIIGSSRWSTSTFGEGNGGSLIIEADDILVDGLSGLSANTVDDGNAGDIVIKGRLQQNSRMLQVKGGGRVSSSTFSKGNGGNINLSANKILIDGGVQFGSLFFPSAISAGAQVTAEKGAAGGTIKIEAGRLTVQERAVISSSTNGMGRGGSVVIEASTLSLRSSGEIVSLTRGPGSAGSVRITADIVTIDGQGLDEFTGIGAQALSDSSGQTGNITIDVKNLLLENNGNINIESSPSVGDANLANIQPTEINITAENITLINSSITTESFGNIPAGSIKINVTDALSLDPSRISTAANNADGGAISIRSNVIDLQDSQITTSVSGQGDGGDIDLNANVLVLDSGFIQANTSGINAQGGDIRINTNVLVAERNNLLTGGDTPLSFQPGVNVIQAAAPDGVSGSIDITTPQLDLSGELIDLDSALVNVDDLAQNPCATTGTKQSTLVSLGRGGLPESPERAGSISITPERLQLLMPLRSSETDPHSGSIHFAPNQYVKSSVESNAWLAWLESNCE